MGMFRRCVAFTAAMVLSFMVAGAKADDLEVRMINSGTDQGVVIIPGAGINNGNVEVGEKIEVEGVGDLVITECSIQDSYMGLVGGTESKYIVLVCNLLNRSHETLYTDGLLQGEVCYLDDYVFPSVDMNSAEVLPYPALPDVTQQYWTIYKEGTRKDRIEIAFYDIIGTGAIAAKWSRSLQLTDNSRYANGSKYYLDGNSWVPFEEGYPRISDVATDVLASSIPIVDGSGNMILEATQFTNSVASLEPMYSGDLAIAFKVPNAVVQDKKNAVIQLTFDGKEYELNLESSKEH